MLEHLPAFWVVTLITAGINAIITMGVYFSNSAGALSAAHAAIAGMGAYTGAVLTTNFDWPFPVALLAGALVGFMIGVLLSLITLRMNELVAGLTTLAFGETMVITAFNLDYIGGANGFIGIPLETTFNGVYLLLALVGHIRQALLEGSQSLPNGFQLRDGRQDLLLDGRLDVQR